MKQSVQDLKSLNMVFEFMCNIAMSGKEFAQKIMLETCILEAISHMLEHCKVFHSDVMVNII